MKEDDYLDSNYLIFCTKNGVIKKTTLRAYSNVRQGGVNAIEIREGDALVQVSMTNGKSEIIMATRDGKAIRFLGGRNRKVLTAKGEKPDQSRSIAAGLATISRPPARI